MNKPSIIKKIVYRSHEYECKELHYYKTGRVNWESDEKILDKWKVTFDTFFGENYLENEIVIGIGRILESEDISHRPSSDTLCKIEQLKEILVETKPDERLGLYYKIFDPLKFRRMKINKILS